MKNIRIILAVLLLIAVCSTSVIVSRSEIEKREIKKDLIELLNIKYGLFSIDVWKDKLAEILTKKINEFNFEGVDKKQIRQKISSLLNEQLIEVEKNYHDEESHSIKGFFQGKVARITGLFDHIKKDIPNMTENIMSMINEPKTKGAIREYILKQLSEYEDKTFSKIDYTEHDRILSKYRFTSREEAIAGLNDKIEGINVRDRPFKIGLIILAAISGLYILFLKAITKHEFLIYTLICFAFLVTGLFLPMIEIDARISNFNFSLLGEPVSFHEQVLYFKSKSILEVVSLMINQERYDSKFVGFLVLLFSVLFPVSKLISSIIYIYSAKIKSNKFIQFMVFKIGKWSMADVMVIAIFMAYIGFTGIITEQLKQIESLSKSIDILTTNKSSLMAGFFSFTSFVILSLILSFRLQQKFKEKDN